MNNIYGSFNDALNGLNKIDVFDSDDEVLNTPTSGTKFVYNPALGEDQWAPFNDYGNIYKYSFYGSLLVAYLNLDFTVDWWKLYNAYPVGSTQFYAAAANHLIADENGNYPVKKQTNTNGGNTGGGNTGGGNTGGGNTGGGNTGGGNTGGGNTGGGGNDQLNPQGPPIPPINPPTEKTFWDNYGTYVLIGAGGIALVTIIYLMSKKNE